MASTDKYKYVTPESSVQGGILMPLKLKYRTIGPKGFGAKARTGQKKFVVTAGTGHRRKAYGPW